MCIKCVFGHTKHVVLACCERVITFAPEITWRVLKSLMHCSMVNLVARLTNYEILFSKIHNLFNNHLSLILTAMSHRMLNVVCFLDYQWPMRLRSTPPTIFIANRGTIISYSWSMKYIYGTWIDGKLIPNESLILWFHGPWHTWDEFMEYSIIWKSCSMVSWPMKYSVTSFHGKFRAHESLVIRNSWVIK